LNSRSAWSIEGEDRKQVTLVPECLDDFIAAKQTENNRKEGIKTVQLALAADLAAKLLK